LIRNEDSGDWLTMSEQEILPVMRKLRGLGSIREIAELVRMAPSTVQHWLEVGHIPAPHQQRVMDFAKEQGVEITPDDFFRPSGVLAGAADPQKPAEEDVQALCDRLNAKSAFRQDALLVAQLAATIFAGLGHVAAHAVSASANYAVETARLILERARTPDK
jgi:hypothetical protein